MSANCFSYIHTAYNKYAMVAARGEFVMCVTFSGALMRGEPRAAAALPGSSYSLFSRIVILSRCC